MAAPSARHESEPADIAQAIYVEQHRLIFAHTAAGTGAATAFAVLVAFQLFHGALGLHLADGLVGWWLAAKLLVVVPRLAHARICRDLPADKAMAWLRWTAPLLAADGLVWGIGCAYLTHESGDVATISAAILCCVASVATFGLQVRASAAAAYVIPMLAPVTLAMLWRGDDVGFIGGTGLILLQALLVSTSRRSQRRIAEVFRLRLLTDRISQERADALQEARMHAQAKDRFLAVVSHELRTPLHGILGLTRLTRTEAAHADVAFQYRLEMVEEAAEHLQRMVNDLLDISSIESGRLELRFSSFDLSRELTLMRETYRSRTDEIGLRMNFFVDPNVGQWVIGDAGRAMQVLHNLIGNACKFTPLGGSVELTVHRVEDGETVLFEVRDTGPGVSEDKREVIFESFVQVHDEAQPRPEGVGLGLAISRELARAMGGEIVYQARVGRGSVFSFTARLPRTLAPEERLAAMSSTKATRRGGMHRTVLVADDDRTSLLLAVSVLRQQGYEVEEFSDGMSLVERVRQMSKPPHAIVLDLDMPQMGGRDVVLAVRADEARRGLPRVPMICVSATALGEAPTELAAAGVDAFLAKPCAPETLTGELERCLAHAATSAKVAALSAPNPQGGSHGR